MIVVYRATCLLTGKVYIGCTQQTVKKRMQGHNNDIRKLLKTGESSDSFAKHFAQQVPQEKIEPTPTAKQLREELCPYEMEVLWHGNPHSTVKTFGSRSCKLCAQERLAIFNTYYSKNRKKLINSNHEIFGACRHKPSFHRYSYSSPGTDDSNKEERVASASSFLFDEPLLCGSCDPSASPMAGGDPSTNGAAAGAQFISEDEAGAEIWVHVHAQGELPKTASPKVSLKLR